MTVLFPEYSHVFPLLIESESLENKGSEGVGHGWGWLEARGLGLKDGMPLVVADEFLKKTHAISSTAQSTQN